MAGALLKKRTAAGHVVDTCCQCGKIGITPLQFHHKRAVILGGNTQRFRLQFSGVDRPGVFQDKHIVDRGRICRGCQGTGDTENEIVCNNRTAVAPFGIAS